MRTVQLSILKLSPIAGRVFTALATCLHLLEAAPFDVDHITGVDNTMADMTSRDHLQIHLHFSLSPPQNSLLQYLTLCRHLNTKIIHKVFALL
jgi:high-affinity nickel permease